jgi:hypothetical protein
MYSWGFNDYGNLGFLSETYGFTPKRIGTDSDWASVSNRFAIKQDGSLYGWGINTYDHLGLAANNTHITYTPTRIGTDSDWASVSSTSYVTYAIKTDGSLHRWGANIYGSLGDETSWQKTPVKIE